MRLPSGTCKCAYVCVRVCVCACVTLQCPLYVDTSRCECGSGDGSGAEMGIPGVSHGLCGAAHVRTHTHTHTYAHTHMRILCFFDLQHTGDPCARVCVCVCVCVYTGSPSVRPWQISSSVLPLAPCHVCVHLGFHKGAPTHPHHPYPQPPQQQQCPSHNTHAQSPHTTQTQ